MKFVIYKDRAGEFRWNLKSNNGEIIADSSEGYINKADVKYAIDLIKDNAKESLIEDSTIQE